MEDFLHRVAGALRELERQQENAVEFCSALHIHVDLRQEKAPDVVDYLRFQLEWCQRRLIEEIEAAGDSGCGTHVLALTIHGARGSADHSSCIRAFLLAGPPTATLAPGGSSSGGSRSRCYGMLAETLQWQCVAVDHFASHFPWGLSPEIILKGSKADIIGVPTLEASNSSSIGPNLMTARFRELLLDALPHVVPLMSRTEDTVSVIHTLAMAFRNSDLLVSLLQEHFRDKIVLQEDRGWRADIANHMALMRRAGSFQLAILSYLSCDHELRSLLDAIRRNSLHTSCPKGASGSGSSSRATAWKAVADHYIREANTPANAVESPTRLPLLSSQKQMSDLVAPGAPALLQLLLPLARASELKRATSRRRGESVLAAVESLAAQMGEMVKAYLPEPLLEVLKKGTAAEALLSGSLGLFGEDAATEVAASVCQDLRSLDLLGRDLQDALAARVRELAAWLLASRRVVENGGAGKSPSGPPPDDEGLLLLALRPVAAAGLLLPVAEYIALVMASMRRAEHAQLGRNWPSVVWTRGAREGLEEPVSDKTTWLDVLSTEAVSLLGSVARQLISSLQHAVETAVQSEQPIETLDPGLHRLRRLATLVQAAPAGNVARQPGLLRAVVLSQMLCDAPGTTLSSARTVLATFADFNRSIPSCLEDLVSRESTESLPVALAGLRHVMTSAPGENVWEAPDLSTLLRLLVSMCSRAGASLPGDLPAPALIQIRQLALFVARQLLSELRNAHERRIDKYGQLPRFIALFADQKVKPGQRSDSGSRLLDELEEFLPLPTVDAAWDHPFVTVLTDALLASSRMVLGVAKHSSIALKFSREREAALEELVGAFNAACDGVEVPRNKLELLLRLALGRALAIQSVVIVAALRSDDQLIIYRPLKQAICRLLFAKVSGRTQLSRTENGVKLGFGELCAQNVPPPFASLFAVTATKPPDDVQAHSTFTVRPCTVFLMLFASVGVRACFFFEAMRGK